MHTQPFLANISQADLDDLQDRLARVRWPTALPDVGWNYGVPEHYVRRLVDYWRGGYDWRQWESKLNTYPQFVTELDGQKIHFLHVRSPEPDALPVILTHGWPGSIYEFIKVIDPLSNPRAYGGQAEDAFHLVIPTLPGFGFSGATHETGWNPERIAKVWGQLMHGLGYERYGAIGNDWGSIISPRIARFHPDQVVGTHVTQIFLEPSGPDDLPDVTPDEQKALAGLEWFKQNMSAYDVLQSQQPQSLAYALTDSPVGLLAWFCLIYREGEGIDDDFVLTNAALYWLTETVASAARIYYEARHMESQPAAPIDTPIGLAMFRDDGKAFRRLAERVYTNILQWTEYDSGGHYAAYQVPDLWLADVHKFFRQLR